MPTIQSVGAELAEVPIGDLIGQLARGIADGQRALDRSSIDALIQLAKTPIAVIPEITEVISAQPRSVAVSGGAPVMVTGVRVSASASEPIVMSALQAGILPTFYQFTEAVIEVKLSLQMRQTTESDEDGTRRLGMWLFASNVNFTTKNTYSYAADAACSVHATLRPVPPPSRLVPDTITVNTLTKPPTITHA